MNNHIISHVHYNNSICCCILLISFARLELYHPNLQAIRPVIASFQAIRLDSFWVLINSYDLSVSKYFIGLVISSHFSDIVPYKQGCFDHCPHSEMSFIFDVTHPSITYLQHIWIIPSNARSVYIFDLLIFLQICDHSLPFISNIIGCSPGMPVSICPVRSIILSPVTKREEK